MDQHRRSRRDMLLAGVSGMAASALTNRTLWAAESKSTSKPDNTSSDPADTGLLPLPAKLRIGLSAYSFRQELDQPGKPGKMSLFDFVDLAARLGVDAVEPTSYYFLRTDDDFLYRLKRKILLAGLEINGTPVRNDFCLPPSPQLDKEIAHVRDWVDICVKLGSPAMRVFAGAPNKTRSDDQAFANCVSAMKEAVTYAASKGIFLGLENHGYLTKTSDDVLRLLDAVNNDWLKVYLDTGNFLGHMGTGKVNGTAYDHIAKVVPYAVTCQVKPYIVSPTTGQRETPDYARIIQILRNARYRGYVTLEYEAPAEPHKEVPVLIRKLQQLTS